MKNYETYSKWNAELLSIHGQLSHYRDALRSGRNHGVHHHSVLENQIPIWLEHISSARSDKEFVLCFPIWTDARFGEVEAILKKVKLIAGDAHRSCFHDGCWSVVELERHKMDERTIATLISALDASLA